MTPRPKKPLLRDEAYLKAVKEMPCVLTGKTPCDPAHIRFGLYGIGMKPADDLVLPLYPDLHREQHAVGEVLFWRAHMNRDLMMEALKALARERYRAWKEANDK